MVGWGVEVGFGVGSRKWDCTRGLIHRRLLPDVCSRCVSRNASVVVVIVVLLFYVHGKHLRSCRDGQLT